VMEYMEGTKVDALASRIESGRLSGKRVVESVVEAYIQMMLVDGLFHADPHPGNLLVTDDGRLVLLDFGMVVESSPRCGAHSLELPSLRSGGTPLE
jgi:Predicted unusual protein kinase